jgi:hypothetical protein
LRTTACTETSSAQVGSSSTTSAGLPEIARAIPARLLTARQLMRVSAEHRAWEIREIADLVDATRQSGRRPQPLQPQQRIGDGLECRAPRVVAGCATDTTPLLLCTICSARKPMSRRLRSKPSS